MDDARTRLDDEARRLDRWALAVILAIGLAQLAFLTIGCDWELSGDEAEFWAWSRRLDWSYFARGPLIAVVIRLGTMLAGDLSMALTGTMTAAVRLPAVVLGAVTAWAVYRLGAEVCQSRRAGLIAVLLLPAVPLFRVGGLLMTCDTPQVCCWAWAAVWSYRALDRNDRRGWLVAGLLGALGVLAKYTMLAFPASVGLYLLLSPERRRHLIRPGFWIMALTCALGMVPIVAWNAAHGWVGMGQLGDRVGMTADHTWKGFAPTLGFLGGEVLVLGITWLFGLRAIVRAARLAMRPGATGLLYLLCLWVVVWSACVAASLVGESEANWATPGYLAVVVLSGWWLDRKTSREGFRARRARPYVVAWVAAVAFLSAMQHTEWFYPALVGVAPAPRAERPAPFRILDPTCRMRGYRALAAEVGRQIAALKAEGREPFLMAPTYSIAMGLSFYLPGQPEVYCLNYSSKGPFVPANQHDLWRPNPRFDPAAFRGRPAIIVQDANSAPSFVGTLVYRRWFEGAGPSARIVEHRGGIPVAAWDVTSCGAYLGEPVLQALAAGLAPRTVR